MTNKSTLSRYWLLLGVSALAVAGLFSLVLVIARTPSLSNLPLFNEIFHKSLVVHVDLSVLVWFLSIACLMWSLLAAGTKPVIPLLEEAALAAFGLGTVLLAVSPLDGKGVALMSNYIPVITSPLFFLGISLLFCGVMLMRVRVFFVCHPREALLKLGSEPDCTRSPNALCAFEDDGIKYGIFGGALIALIAAMAFIWSYRQLGHGFDPQQYYELLFWGGGHVLQLLHVQMVMIVWIMLAKALKPQFSVYPSHLYVLFSIGLVSSLCVPWAYLHYGADDESQRQFFTHMMILAGGIAPTILALWIAPGLITFRHLWRGEKRALYSALCMSLILFIYGGALGALIQGQNVVIPAHYHGSIVGVTLAFMGAAYLLLPQFGYRDVSGWKMAFWQPIVYGGGQLLHVSGLAWSGGYGVLRKTPGGMDGLSAGVKAAMGLMGLGGVIAIIGGFMFVIVVWRAVKR